jgi:hypothetical protein
MIINILHAEYVENFKLKLLFNNRETLLVDLEETIMNDSRSIFAPLRNPDYFKAFSVRLNTVTWENEADFAPEYLLELGQKQLNKIMADA